MRRNIRVEFISNSNLFFFLFLTLASYYIGSLFLNSSKDSLPRSLFWHFLCEFGVTFSFIFLIVHSILNSDSLREISLSLFSLLLMNITYDEESHSARILQFGY